MAASFFKTGAIRVVIMSLLLNFMGQLLKIAHQICQISKLPMGGQLMISAENLSKHSLGGQFAKPIAPYCTSICGFI
jgi:hypothetical protein